MNNRKTVFGDEYIQKQENRKQKELERQERLRVSRPKSRAKKRAKQKAKKEALKYKLSNAFCGPLSEKERGQKNVQDYQAEQLRQDIEERKKLKQYKSIASQEDNNMKQRRENAKNKTPNASKRALEEVLLNDTRKADIYGSADIDGYGKTGGDITWATKRKSK